MTMLTQKSAHSERVWNKIFLVIYQFLYIQRFVIPQKIYKKLSIMSLSLQRIDPISFWWQYKER